MLKAKQTLQAFYNKCREDTNHWLYLRDNLQGIGNLGDEYIKNPLYFLFKYCTKFWKEFVEYLSETLPPVQGSLAADDATPSAQSQSKVSSPKDMMRTFYSKRKRIYKKGKVVDDAALSYYEDVITGKAALAWVPSNTADKQFFENCAESVGGSSDRWKVLQLVMPEQTSAEFWLVDEDTPHYTVMNRKCYCCGHTLRAFVVAPPAPFVAEGLPVFNGKHHFSPQNCVLSQAIEKMGTDIDAETELLKVQNDNPVACWSCLLTEDSLIKASNQDVDQESNPFIRARGVAKLVKQPGQPLVTQKTCQAFTAAFPETFDERYKCLLTSMPYMGLNEQDFEQSHGYDLLKEELTQESQATQNFYKVQDVINSEIPVLRMKTSSQQKEINLLKAEVKHLKRLEPLEEEVKHLKSLISKLQLQVEEVTGVYADDPVQELPAADYEAERTSSETEIITQTSGPTPDQTQERPPKRPRNFNSVSQLLSK